ncbi:AbrB/MazE/SpoVT family DNA-binding domain-containing protein [uncultured Rhodoblastus sp.]|uniref:AbrB/MazE/SpoVT family DNA-binding domain-containing protein n=1 Tax=uncultured Rhodoblastus sp. TaxID=543037 RepID=UPI0025FEF1AC|nr:AbrB/MazE/SpoVT family DNA-binding domain-containing protein [uncultured Rhodoblastus sp.]
MTTKMTVKGQVTLPKAVRDAAGIKPGDRVEVRHVRGVGVVIERRPDDAREAFRLQLEDISRRQPFKGLNADALTDLTRGED